MSFVQAEGHRLFGFNTRIDPGVFQCGEVGFRIRARQVTFERDRATGEELLDGFDVTLEQLSQVQLGRGAFDTREQGSIKHNLETVVAHAGFLVT